MFRHAIAALVICLFTTSAVVVVDAHARGLMAHQPWQGTDTAVGAVVIHESATEAAEAARALAHANARLRCDDGEQALPLGTAEVSVDAGGETSTQVEIAFTCVAG
jgi:hypothetical protein